MLESSPSGLMSGIWKRSTRVPPRQISTLHAAYEAVRLLRVREGRLPRRPIFLLVTEPNDSSGGTDLSAFTRPWPEEGVSRPFYEKSVPARRNNRTPYALLKSKEIAESDDKPFLPGGRSDDICLPHGLLQPKCSSYPN